MSAREEAKRAFMEATFGIAPHKVAYAMNYFTPGINWRGCSRKDTADEYAKANDPECANSYTNLKGIDLQVLRFKALGERTR